MKKFNSNKNLHERLLHDLEHYFSHYWNNNSALTVQSEWYHIVMQLDQEHKHILFCNFLYMEVRKVFSKFLTIPNCYTKRRFKFFLWNDTLFQSFIQQFFVSLEPIEVHSLQLLFQEEEEVNLVYFFTTGSFKVGFEIMGRRFYPLMFSNQVCGTEDHHPDNICSKEDNNSDTAQKKINMNNGEPVGYFYLNKKCRAKFNYKTKTRCVGYFIRRQNWRKLLEFESQEIRESFIFHTKARYFKMESRLMKLKTQYVDHLNR